MARRKSKPRAKGGGWFIPLAKWLILTVFTVAAVFYLTRMTVRFMKRAPLFRVDEVVMDPGLHMIDRGALEKFQGRSIFEVDIAALQKTLQARYPQVDRIRVLRRFPNELIIMAEPREPFAVVQTGDQAMIVDRQGVVLSLSADEPPPLPRIRGVDALVAPALGQPIHRKDLAVGLSIISSVAGRDRWNLTDIKDIDVGNMSMIPLNFNNGLQVIMDQDQVPHKVRQLDIVLNQLQLDLKDVNYVDLRFKEPVLGTKPLAK